MDNESTASCVSLRSLEKMYSVSYWIMQGNFVLRDGDFAVLSEVDGLFDVPNPIQFQVIGTVVPPSIR